MIDEPLPPHALVDHARLTARKHGKPLLKEQIDVLDGLIAQRCSSARANATVYGPQAWDWEVWGRTTYVLEAVLSFLQRLDADPAAKDYLAKRFRREVIRDAKGDTDDGKIPVDNSGGRPAEKAGGEGSDLATDRRPHGALAGGDRRQDAEGGNPLA